MDENEEFEFDEFIKKLKFSFLKKLEFFFVVSSIGCAFGGFLFVEFKLIKFQNK